MHNSDTENIEEIFFCVTVTNFDFECSGRGCCAEGCPVQPSAMRGPRGGWRRQCTLRVVRVRSSVAPVPVSPLRCEDAVALRRYSAGHRIASLGVALPAAHLRTKSSALCRARRQASPRCAACGVTPRRSPALCVLFASAHPCLHCAKCFLRECDAGTPRQWGWVDSVGGRMSSALQRGGRVTPRRRAQVLIAPGSVPERRPGRAGAGRGPSRSHDCSPRASPCHRRGEVLSGPSLDSAGVGSQRVAGPSMRTGSSCCV